MNWRISYLTLDIQSVVEKSCFLLNIIGLCMCQLKNTSSSPPLNFHQKRNFGTAAVTVASKIYNHTGIDCQNRTGIDCQKWNDHAVVDIYGGKRNRARTQKLTPRRLAQQFENWAVHLHLWNQKYNYCVYTYQKVDLNKTVPLTCIFKLQKILYEGWNFNSGNYLFTTDTK